MESVFRDLSARVLLVEPSANVRGMISDVLKSLGFQNIQAMDTAKSGLSYLEVENADWIIAPLQGSEPVNSLHILGIINKHEKFRETMFSMLVEDNELEHLAQAFHMGLASWHAKTSLSKDGLVREFKEFLEVLEEQKNDRVFVAFEYLQTYLRSAGKADLLIESCKDIVKSFPTHANPVFNLAGSLLALDRREEARKVLGHAKASGIPGWEKFAKDNLNDGEEILTILPCKRILVVDPDESIHNHLRETLLKYCEKAEIKFCVDGQSAVDWLSGNPSVDLVVQEWRIPILTGHVFLQRLRQITNRMIPVIVLSSLLRKEDVPILSEMGVASGIEKPMEEKAFFNSAFQAIQQITSPTTAKWIERKIQERLAMNDLRAVELYYNMLRTHKDCTDDQRLYVQALRFFHVKDYESAKILAIKAIQLGGDQIKTFTLLGRCLACMREFEGAVKCFEHAQSLSPKNIERLCELAEAQVEAGQEEAAKESLESAKSLDQGNQSVSKAEAKVSIMTGDTEKARDLMYHMGSIEQLVSDMNGSAVALVRVGKFEEGVQLYNRTLESIPEDDHVTKTRVIYNLALAFSRKGDLPSAKLTVDKAFDDIDHPVKEKLNSLRTKLERALSGKTPVKLNTVAAAKGEDTNPWEQDASEAENLLKTEPVISGEQTGPLKSDIIEHGVMGIVRLPESVREVSNHLLKSPPLFSLRSAIAREESMGAEKLTHDGQ